MNQAKMRVALCRGDFLEQFGFKKFRFGALLMKICVFEAFDLWLLVNHRRVTSLDICFGKKKTNQCCRFNLPLTNKCFKINHLVMQIMKFHKVRVHDAKTIHSKCNTIKQNWRSHTFKIDVMNICVVVGTHVVPCKLGVSLCLASSSTIMQLVINGP